VSSSHASAPFAPNLAWRQRKARMFRRACAAVTWMAVAILAMMLVHIALAGWQWVDGQFLSSFPSRFPEKAGIKVALWGTVWVIALTALISIPTGVAASIYLEEYAKPTRLNRIIDVNISNLAGVPSIVYGMLGATIFVRWLALDRSILSGSLTMSLLVLPVIIIASREAIRAVPSSLRHAALALGATKWQTVRGHVLPAATPGIVTGVILALSRAMGETAPLIMIGAAAFVSYVPSSPTDGFTTLPIQIFNWASRPQPEFHELAAAGILVLLVVLLVMNAIAVFIRHRSQKNRTW
jgi:phosphate transport system permease protein